MAERILIDGSYGEGGGQVLRTSVSLAAITGKAVEIVNIRGKRPKPGLQPQHLMAVRAGAQLCGAELRGDAVGSVHLILEPTKKPESGEYSFDIGTAGATTLVMQTVLMPLVLAGGESRIAVKGGTANPHAPTAEFLELAFLPAMRRAGLEAAFHCSRAGYFPKGGGLAELTIHAPNGLTGLDFGQRGAERERRAVIVTSGLPETVAERGSKVVAPLVPHPEHRDLPAMDKGVSVFLGAEFDRGIAGFVGIGARGKPMEAVCQEPVDAMTAWLASSASCDEHLADQLVLPMALARGPSRWSTPEVSEHLRTVIWVVGHFLDREIRLDPGGVVEVGV